MDTSRSRSKNASRKASPKGVSPPLRKSQGNISGGFNDSSPEKNINFFHKKSQSVGFNNDSSLDMQGSPEKKKKKGYLQELQETLLRPSKLHAEEEAKKRSGYKKNKWLIELLQSFESNNISSKLSNVLSPTSEKMKNSIFFFDVGSMKKESIRIIEKQMYRDLEMKYPGPRDRHTSCVMDNLLIIFGGDRHNLSYCDLFTLNLDAFVA